MQHLTYGISFGNYYGRDRASRYTANVCTNVAPRPMTVLFGLGTSAHAYSMGIGTH